ncbi:MAG: competence/damage-inducible protein A [Veillonellales bacterium]
MIVELISTGTELLLGEIVNTDAPYLARQLNGLGFDVLYQSTVGDNRQRITKVLKTALERSDIIITSGGLGPTQGDITKEVTAKLLKRELKLHEATADRIHCFFAARHNNMPNNNLRQAMIPEGAIVLDNERGTAPGVVLEQGDKTVIHLPGPPRELEWMFQNRVVPYLKQRFGGQGIIYSRILHTTGIGESLLEEQIKDFILAQNNPTIALLARKGEIIIRLTAKADNEAAAKVLLDTLEEKIHRRIGEYIFGHDEESMEGVVGSILAAKKLTVACAESCTGGLVTSRLTDIPGSSQYLIGSVVCYSNRIKMDEIGVPEKLLIEYGAVSQETAGAMAAGIRKNYHTNIGLGITGIAGPDGGTENKPVGLVYIAIEGPSGIQCYQHNFTGQRLDIKYRASQAALEVLRRYAVHL